MLTGKNKKIYSYNSKDKRESDFRYKDFEKTKSYRSDFAKTRFDYASLRASHMKYWRPGKFGFDLYELPEMINELNCISRYTSTIVDFQIDYVITYITDNM